MHYREAIFELPQIQNVSKIQDAQFPKEWNSGTLWLLHTIGCYWSSHDFHFQLSMTISKRVLQSHPTSLLEGKGKEGPNKEEGTLRTCCPMRAFPGMHYPLHTLSDSYSISCACLCTLWFPWLVWHLLGTPMQPFYLHDSSLACMTPYALQALFLTHAAPSALALPQMLSFNMYSTSCRILSIPRQPSQPMPSHPLLYHFQLVQHLSHTPMSLLHFSWPVLPPACCIWFEWHLLSSWPPHILFWESDKMKK